MKTYKDTTQSDSIIRNTSHKYMVAKTKDTSYVKWIKLFLSGEKVLRAVRIIAS